MRVFASSPRVAIASGVLLGGFTGIVLRLMYMESSIFGPTSGLLMTLSFLILGPFAVGWVTASVAERAAPRRWWERMFLPWPAIFLSMALTSLLALEGFICIVFALPIALVFASVGGLAGGGAAAVDSGHAKGRLAVVLLLPVVMAPLESRLTPPTQLRRVETEIAIRATPAVVWSEVERVRPIAREELRPTWTHAIGFPRPVEATLSHEGVGGVRHASFEHGLVFVETVTRWEPERVLGFGIKADTEHLPPRTLDEHVKVGGRFFDVLDGEYRLDPLPGGRGAVAPEQPGAAVYRLQCLCRDVVGRGDAEFAGEHSGGSEEAVRADSELRISLAE